MVLVSHALMPMRIISLAVLVFVEPIGKHWLRRAEKTYFSVNDSLAHY